jgi:hypothetical protein
MSLETLIRSKKWRTPRAQFYAQIDEINSRLGLASFASPLEAETIKAYVTKELQEKLQFSRKLYTLEQLLVVLGFWSKALLNNVEDKAKEEDLLNFFALLERSLQKKFYDQNVLEIIFKKINQPAHVWPAMEKHVEPARAVLTSAFEQLSTFFSNAEIKKKIVNNHPQLLSLLSVEFCQRYLPPAELIANLPSSKEQQIRLLKTEQRPRRIK